VGYRLLDSLGSLSGSRVTSDIGEILSGTGIYSSSIYFSTNFSGSVLWDTGESTPTYATEEYNPQPEHITLAKDIHAGRWVIDQSTKQMIFYKEDNNTEVIRYNLKDKDGNGSVENVFERVKV